MDNNVECLMFQCLIILLVVHLHVYIITDEETDDPPPYSPIKEPHPQWQDKLSHVESVPHVSPRVKSVPQVSPSVESVPQVSPTPPCPTALYPALPSKESLDHALSAVKFYWSYQEYSIIFLPTCPLTKNLHWRDPEYGIFLMYFL